MIQSSPPVRASQTGNALSSRQFGLANFCFLGALAALLFFGMLGAVPLFNPDEGLYAEPAREMLETGEWITTFLNYAVRFTKPPLVIWAMALSYKVFGVNEFAARFFCAATALVMVLMTYAFAERFFGKKCAFLAGLILLTAPLFIGVGREAITDMPLTLFIAGSLFSFYFAFSQKSSLAKWSAYILVGLAVMTKGPVGALLPGVILAVFYYLRGELKNAVKFFNLPIGALLVAAIALPWFVIEIKITDGAYFREFIMRENLERYTSVVDAHKGPIWYHLAVVMGGLFPWSLFIPQMLLRSYRFVREALKDRDSNLNKVWGAFKAIKGACEEMRADRALALFLSVTTVVIIAFFSASVSKLLPYTLPAFPALAILIARELEKISEGSLLWRAAWPIFLLILVFGAAGVIAPVALSHLHDGPAGIAGPIGAYGLCAAALTVLCLFIYASRSRYLGFVALAIALFGLNCWFGAKVLPDISKGLEGDIPAYSRFAAASDDPIIVFGIRKPGVPFYTRRKVFQQPDIEEVRKIFKKSERAYVITRFKYLKDLVPEGGFKVIAKDERFLLLEWQKARVNRSI